MGGGGIWQSVPGTVGAPAVTEDKSCHRGLTPWLFRVVLPCLQRQEVRAIRVLHRLIDKGRRWWRGGEGEGKEADRHPLNAFIKMPKGVTSSSVAS